jgi:uncharacterized protein YejL (UPF0352 family)
MGGDAMQLLDYHLNLTTLITLSVCGIILFISFLGFLFRTLAHYKGKPVGPITSLAPSIAISLGIFGTFCGIYLGLRHFDTADINSSIPQLLEGLKTAFVTSLCGMFFSILLKYIYGNFDRRDLKKETVASEDPLTILRQIGTGISSLTVTVNQIGETLVRCFHAEEEYSLVSQLKLIRSDMNDLKREVTRSLNEFGEKVAELGTEAMISALREVIDQFNARLNDLVGAEFKQLKDAMLKLVEWQENHRRAVDDMQSKLSEYLQHVKMATELLEKAENSMSKASTHLDEIDSSLSAVSVSVEDIDKHVITLETQNEQLKALLEAIKTLGEEAKGVLPSITQHVDALTSEFNDAARQAKNQIEQAGRSIGQSVEAVGNKMESFTETHAQQVDKSLDQITNSLENTLNTSLNSLAGQLAALSNKFAEDYTPLTNQLREVVRLAEGIHNA